MARKRPRTSTWKKRTKVRKAKLRKPYDTKLGVPPRLMETPKKAPLVSKKKKPAATAGKK